ncbi:Hypothetical predicted protein, partial [Pelobates cultripes]
MARLGDQTITTYTPTDSLPPIPQLNILYRQTPDSDDDSSNPQPHTWKQTERPTTTMLQHKIRQYLRYDLLAATTHKQASTTLLNWQ